MQSTNHIHSSDMACDGVREEMVVCDGVREEMVEFWQEHSKEANEEEMMLDSNAEELGSMEVPEILSILPPLHSTRVLELGAGIGRFTGKIALQAKCVTAVDFMHSFVEGNRKKNGHMSNITFLQADVTRLNFRPNSFDLIFSNWLLMYLEEKEVEILFRKCFDWLSPNGFLFFRESCFYQSGNKSRDSNPTLYRHPCIYNNIIININNTHRNITTKNTGNHHLTKNGGGGDINCGGGDFNGGGGNFNGGGGDFNGGGGDFNGGGGDFNGGGEDFNDGGGDFNGGGEDFNGSGKDDNDDSAYRFELVEARSVQTYIKIKKNRNQICWNVQKTRNTQKTSTNTTQNKVFEHVIDDDVIVDDITGGTVCSMVSGELEILKKVEERVEVCGDVLVMNCGRGAVVQSLSCRHSSSSILGVDDVFNDVSMALQQANHGNNLQIQYQASRDYSNLRLHECFDVVLNLVPLRMRQHRNFCSAIKTNMRQDGRLIVLQYVKDSDIVNDDDDVGELLDKINNVKLLTKSGWECEKEFDVTEEKLLALEKDFYVIDNDDGAKVKRREEKRRSMMRLKNLLNSGIRLHAFVCRLKRDACNQN